MACSSYDSCRKRENKTLKYPTDTNSLYADRIYDKQIENTICYQKNPITILEGFGSSGGLFKLILIVLVILLLVALFTNCFKPVEVVDLGLNTPSTTSIPVLEFDGMRGGKF